MRLGLAFFLQFSYTDSMIPGGQDTRLIVILRSRRTVPEHGTTLHLTPRNRGHVGAQAHSCSHAVRHPRISSCDCGQCTGVPVPCRSGRGVPFPAGGRAGSRCTTSTESSSGVSRPPASQLGPGRKQSRTQATNQGLGPNHPRVGSSSGGA